MRAPLGARKLGRAYLVGACMYGLCSCTRKMQASGASCCALLCNVDAGIRAQMMQASGPRRCRRLGLNVCLLAFNQYCGIFLDTRVLSRALAHGDAGVWGLLLCTLVQCRCG